MLASKELIGRMDRRITFQEVIGSPGDYNVNNTTGWADISSNATVYAQVEEGLGNEAYEGDQLVSIKQSKMTIRYRTDINARNRIVYEGLIYEILSIREIVRRRYLEIKVEEKGIFNPLGEGFSEGYTNGFRS